MGANLPFIALLFGASALAHVVQLGLGAGRRGLNVGFPFAALAFASATALLSLFAGLRGLTVGTDTRLMVGIFHRTSAESLSSAIQNSAQEPGYTVLLHFLRRLTDDPRWLLTTMSVATVLLCLGVIVRRSPSIASSVLVYIGLGSYLATFNIMRQGLAVALCFAAWSTFREKRWLSIALLCLAATFHVTAIVAGLAIILTMRVRPSRSWLMAVAATTAFAILAGGEIGLYWTGMLNERFAEYVAAGEQSGGGTAVMMGVFLIVISGTLGWAKSAGKELQHAWVLLSLAPVFMAFGLHIVPMGRIEMYFSIFATLVIAAFVRSRKYFGWRILLAVSSLIYMVVYLGSWGGLLPYVAELTGAVSLIAAVITVCTLVAIGLAWLEKRACDGARHARFGVLPKSRCRSLTRWNLRQCGTLVAGQGRVRNEPPVPTKSD